MCGIKEATTNAFQLVSILSNLGDIELDFAESSYVIAAAMEDEPQRAREEQAEVDFLKVGRIGPGHQNLDVG